VQNSGTEAAEREAATPERIGVTDQAQGGLTTGQPAPGWYPDPQVRGQHRYWTGGAWTADVFPDGPIFAEPEPATYWPPYRPDVEPPVEAVVPTTRGRSGRPLAVVALVIGLVVGFVAVVAIVNAVTGKSASSTSDTLPAAPGTTLPQGPAPAVPADPNQSALSALVVGQSDVTSTASVQPLPGGDTVTDQPTLDLCNGNFPSEALRTARLQVAAFDAQGSEFISTEAVLYRTPAGSAQAFRELTATAAGCPATPVTSPVGEPTVTTKFNPAPDGTWPQTPSVERLAYDFTATDSAGPARHSVAVYLRRGRALLGVYFSQPDAPQAPVGGQTSIAAIVNLFAARMAQLPASVVSG
jgi:Protein of unknown function (DUF2510)